VTCATFAVLKRESSSFKNHGGPAKGGGEPRTSPPPLNTPLTISLLNIYRHSYGP